MGREGRKGGSPLIQPLPSVAGGDVRSEPSSPSTLGHGRPGSLGGGHLQAQRGGPLADGQRYLQAWLSRSSCERTGAASLHRWPFVPLTPAICLFV